MWPAWRMSYCVSVNVIRSVLACCGLLSSFCSFVLLSADGLCVELLFLFVVWGSGYIVVVSYQNETITFEVKRFA